MREYKYIITDDEGIHARPAGALVKKANEFSCTVTLEANGKPADAKRILGVMGLGAGKDTELTVRTEGEDEDKAIEELESFLKENL